MSGAAPGKALPPPTLGDAALGLTAGLVVGVVVVIVAISFGALVFSGDLEPFTGRGIGFGLFSAAVVGFVITLRSSFPGMIATPQDSPAAILALVAAAIASRLPAQAPPEAVFATVVVAVGGTSLVTGGFFLALGSFKLGGLVRFIPYPVIGGFLAGTGWLLVQGSFSVMAGTALSWSGLSTLAEPGILIRWLPGLGFAVLLLLVLRRAEHFLVLPGMLLGAVALFFVALGLTGTSLAEAAARGLLLGPLPEGGLWQPLAPAELAQVDWGVIASQAGSCGAILALGVVGLLLNSSGLELALERDVDLDRELTTAGVANLLSGAGGGLLGYQTLSLSALGHRIAPSSRWVGIGSAGLCTATLLFGTSVLSQVPRAALGGLLLFLGLSFLMEWVVDAWRRLPRTDYAVVLLILLVIATVGFLESVGLGVVLAVVLFVVNYSRIDVVKHSLSGAHHQSNVDRPEEHRRRLRERGAEQLILTLQGFLFFGTAHRLLERVRQRASDPQEPPLGFVILDFRQVSGLDSSAALSFVKLKQLAQAQGFSLVLAQLSPELRSQLVRSGLDPAEDATVRFFPELDRGIQWCEDRILEAAGVDLAVREKNLLDRLRPTFGQRSEVLLTYLERVEVDAGQHLMRQGAAAENLYFLESGTVTAQIELDGEEAVRLLTMGPGAVVGEMEVYLERARSASVVTEEPSVVYRLSREALGRMEREHSTLAAAFHKFIARMLADRLANTNSTLQAVLR